MTSGEAEEEDPEGTSKRELEGGAAEEPEATRPRVDEGSGQVEERPEKIQRGEPSGTVRRIMATRSVQEVASFLRKDLPKYHDDEEVELEEFEGLEVEFEGSEEDRSSELGEDEEFEESMPKWSNKFEDGPPKLDEDELAKVDVTSREHEISRLTEMKVLKELPEGTSVSSYKYLSTKVVYDWRHRDNEWQRRGRLVAREFRWLGSTDIATLFFPTGVASTVKLLSAMFVSSNDHILGSIDVGDAYLMVEQEKPTVVEVDGKYYELGFTLPGQRIGSSAWFNKLKGYLEEYGLKSDEGLPALFYRRPEKGKAGMVVLSHVDDMELYATKEEFQELIEFLRKKKLKIKVEGPLSVHEGSMSFLKRGFSAVNDGDVEITMNSKYIEGLIEALELEQAYPKKLPCPADNGRAMQAKKGGMDPSSEEDHHAYRKGVGILLYLAPERPDLMYVLKKLSTKLAAPVEADMELLRHAAKYLKGTPDVSLIHKKSYPGRSFIEERNEGKEKEVERNIYEQESLLEIVTDSDWAADRESRQSVSCGAIMLNGNLIHFQSKRQKSIALSSCEAETIAATSILSEGVFLKALLTRILGKEPKMVMYSDSSSSRQLIARKGLGKARHLDVDLLWIQSIPRLIIKAIKGKDNPADLGTKSLSKDKIRKYMASLGYVGEIVDQEEVTGNGQVRRLNGNGRSGNGRKVSEEKLTKIIQAVTMAVLVALGEAKKFSEEEEESGKHEGSTLCMKVMIVLTGCVCCYLMPVAAVLRIKLLRVERKERREGMAEEHSDVMEQRVEELAEMRQRAMARRENLLQENAPEKEEEGDAPEGEEEEKRSEDEPKASSEKGESYSSSYYSSSSTEAEEPKEAEKPDEGEGQKNEDYLHLSEEGLWAVTRQSALLEEENRMVLEGENALNLD